MLTSALQASSHFADLPLRRFAGKLETAALKSRICGVTTGSKTPAKSPGGRSCLARSALLQHLSVLRSLEKLAAVGGVRGRHAHTRPRAASQMEMIAPTSLVRSYSFPDLSNLMFMTAYRDALNKAGMGDHRTVHGGGREPQRSLLEERPQHLGVPA